MGGMSKPLMGIVEPQFRAWSQTSSWGGGEAVSPWEHRRVSASRDSRDAQRMEWWFQVQEAEAAYQVSIEELMRRVQLAPFAVLRELCCSPPLPYALD